MTNLTSSPLHIAMIGTGRIAKAFQRDIAAFGHRVSGFVSSSAARVSEFAAESGLPGFSSLEELLKARPETSVADFYGAKIHLFRYDHAAKDTILERTEDFSLDLQNELHHDMTGFLGCYLGRIASGNGPLVPASEALQTMRLAFAVEKSISEGGPVALAG